MYEYDKNVQSISTHEKRHYDC